MHLSFLVSHTPHLIYTYTSHSYLISLPPCLFTYSYNSPHPPQTAVADVIAVKKDFADMNPFGELDNYSVS